MLCCLCLNRGREASCDCLSVKVITCISAMLFSTMFCLLDQKKEQWLCRSAALVATCFASHRTLQAYTCHPQVVMPTHAAQHTKYCGFTLLDCIRAVSPRWCRQQHPDRIQVILPPDCNIKGRSVLCRGDRSKLAACQQAWYASSTSPQQQARLACQLWDESTESDTSYLRQQCSRGYEGPLCNMCQSGYGVSGKHNHLSHMLWLWSYIMGTQLCYTMHVSQEQGFGASQ